PGELGFFKGDVITVLDQKYRDWWKGELRTKSGIFPANFVQPLLDPRANISKDLEFEAQVFSEAHNIEALLRLLGSVDPVKDNVSENEEVQRLYGETVALRPRIVRLIERYTKKREELVLLDAQFSKSIRLYDDILRRSVGAAAGGQQQGVYAQQGQGQGQAQGQQQHQVQPQQQMYAGYSAANMQYSQSNIIVSQPQQQQQQQPYIMSQAPVGASQPQRVFYQPQLQPLQQQQQQQPLQQQSPGQQIQVQPQPQPQPQVQAHYQQQPQPQQHQQYQPQPQPQQQQYQQQPQQQAQPQQMQYQHVPPQHQVQYQNQNQNPAATLGTPTGTAATTATTYQQAQ
ncbi:hypothetical protein GGF37_003404, partial [Kickxella alabastrina]